VGAGVLGLKLDGVAVEFGGLRMPFGLGAVRLRRPPVGSVLGPLACLAFICPRLRLALTRPLLAGPGLGGVIGIVHTGQVPLTGAPNQSVSP
jgi:hypothetical protein